MDPSQYLKNYPQPLHLHPNSSFRLHNNSHDNNSFRHNSPRSRDRPYFNRRRGHSLQLSQKRNSESQYSSDSFNDSSSSSSMNSPHFRNYSQRNYHSSGQADISQYFHPSMLEDPWAGLVTSSITQSRQANIQSGKVQTYDSSSSDEETPASTQQDNSSSGDDEDNGDDDNDEEEKG